MDNTIIKKDLHNYLLRNQVFDMDEIKIFELDGLGNDRFKSQVRYSMPDENLIKLQIVTFKYIDGRILDYSVKDVFEYDLSNPPIEDERTTDEETKNEGKTARRKSPQESYDEIK